MGAPAILTPMPATSIDGRKRRKGPKDTPPGGAAKPTKRHKPVRPPVDILPAGVGLTSAQRANLLSMVVAALGYPDSVLTAEQFEPFREVTWRALEKVPPNQWPKFETA